MKHFKLMRNVLERIFRHECGTCTELNASTLEYLNAFYFLICLVRLKLLGSWGAKAALVFLAASSVEVAQLPGLPVFGRTYDPLDFFMYGTGMLLAVLLNIILFLRLFSFWQVSQLR